MMGLLIFIPILIYWLLITWYISGWLKLHSKVLNSLPQEPFAQVSAEGYVYGNHHQFVTVLVPFRNESKHIYRLLEAFDKQEFNSERFEIILIDDHSSDDSVDKIMGFKFKRLKPTLLRANANEQGKKAALIKGIDVARGEIIVCTDADCTMDKDWIRTMMDGFRTSEIKMVCGPVMYFERKGFWNHMVQLEFLSLIGIGASSIENGHPTMCNGANIAYRKSVYFEINGFVGNDHIPSGDDEFLMHKIHESYKNSIHFLKNAKAMVYTEAPSSLNAFVNQRIRWGSKAVHYKSFRNKVLPAFVFTFNILLLSTSFLWIFGMPWTFIAILWMGKLLADLLFFTAILPFFKQSKLLELVIPAQILHVVYISTIGMLALTKSYIWKGRSSKN